MAQIILLLREESSQSQLENGVSGVGAIQTRELGYTEEKQEFSFKTAAGALRHITSREKMLLAAAAATSGAKGVGYFPASGLSSVTVQDALDELRGQVAAGGGGTVLGTGTAGALTKWTNSTTLGNSILTESGSAIRFSGDAVANLYRSAAGTLKTDGDFYSATLVNAPYFIGNHSIIGIYNVVSTPNDGDFENYFYGSFQRNSAGPLEHNLLRVKANLNAGGSNSGETLNLLSVDTSNSSTTGMSVNLLTLSYGSVTKFNVSSAGNVLILGTLGLTGDFAINTNKFTVNATTGYTVLNGYFYNYGSAQISGPAADYSEARIGLNASTTFNLDASANRCVSVSSYLTVNTNLTDLYRLHLDYDTLLSGASIDNAVGLKIEDVNLGSTTNRAIQTGIGLIDFGDRLLTKASVSGKAGLNVPHGTAPSSPVDGDIWTTTAGLYVRINGATIGPLT